MATDGLRQPSRPHGTRLFVQLFHGGREQIASRAAASGPRAVVRIPSQRFRDRAARARPEEIERIVSGYASSAALAAEAGLDGVEVSAAHRYLVEQFFDPALNRRDDEWGDGRRFLRAVLKAVRTAAPALCLGVRVSGDSGVGREIAEAAVAEGVDYLSVALGDSSTYLGSVGIVPPPPIEENAVARHLEGFRLGPPLIANSRIVDPGRANRLIGEGTARCRRDDAGTHRRPRASREGRRGPPRPALYRVQHVHRALPRGNGDRMRGEPPNRARANAPAARARRRRDRLVVVGGGPAGLPLRPRQRRRATTSCCSSARPDSAGRWL